MANNPYGMDHERLSSYRARNPQALQALVAGAVDLFARGAVLTRQVWIVAGVDGIASVPSPGAPDAATFLVWSQQHEAERWADVLAVEPRVLGIGLATFIMETLPAIAAAGGQVGLDWSADPAEAEVAPGVLAAAIRSALTSEFVALAVKTRTVWLLQDADGIAAIATCDGLSRVVPVWADRTSAEAVAKILGGELMTQRLPLLDLTNRYLLSAQGLKAKLAPGYVHAPEPLALTAWAFKALLNGGNRAHVQVA